jgi:HAD superfamily hydrolase (TIGR01509 family)
VTAPNRFATLLFDVDGTLIDSNGAHAQAWAQSLAEHAIVVPFDRVRRAIGMGSDKLLPAVAGVSHESAPGRALIARKKEIFGTLLPSLRPTRGARSLLEHVRRQGIDLVVATSADDRELHALLKQAGVDDLFQERASKDDADASKPDPDIVHAAMTRSGARKDSTALIGDTPYDLEAANRAGIAAIALRCGGYWSDQDLSRAMAIFDDPEALHAWWTSAANAPSPSPAR